MKYFIKIFFNIIGILILFLFLNIIGILCLVQKQSHLKCSVFWDTDREWQTDWRTEWLNDRRQTGQQPLNPPSQKTLLLTPLHNYKVSFLQRVCNICINYCTTNNNFFLLHLFSRKWRCEKCSNHFLWTYFV